MAKFYIQLENKLLQISGELIAENISKALGYVPVSPNVTNELSQRVDNITFDSLKDNPFLQDGSGELNIVDESGNIIAKIDAEGIHSVDFIAGTHRLSNKTDKTYVDEAVKNVEVDLTGYATEEYVNNIDFYNIKDNPIVNNGDGKLLFVDENGYIGLQLEEDGLYVKDVIADGHTLSQKADKSDIPSLDGYATESYVNTELENYATKEDIKDIASNSILIELSGKVSTLIGEDTDKSVRDIAVDVLTETLVSETATEAYDTLAEMSAWIKSHPEDAAAMNTAIQKNATDITNLDAAYKAANAKVLTDAQEYTDNINFYTIKDNPILDNNDGNLTFVDESGNIGLQFSNNAILVNDVITPEHTLSNKADKSELNKKQDALVSGTNIKTVNGESLLGEGNIVVSGGSNSSGGAYALVEHGTNDTTFTLTPNTFHVWGEVGSLTLTLGEEQSGVANEFLFQFESGETATTLTLPDDLIWANDDTPVIESNYTYQVSILKGLAAIMKFKKKTNLIENKLTVTNGGMNSTFTFEYPVASDVSVTFTSDFGDTDIVTIYSGSMSGKTDSAPGYNSLTNNNIEYITPEKDSVYIYTF